MCTQLVVLGEHWLIPRNPTPQASSTLLVRQLLGPISQGLAGSASITNSHLILRPTKYACQRGKRGAKWRKQAKVSSLVSRVRSLNTGTVGLSTRL